MRCLGPPLDRFKDEVLRARFLQKRTWRLFWLLVHSVGAVNSNFCGRQQGDIGLSRLCSQNAVKLLPKFQKLLFFFLFIKIIGNIGQEKKLFPNMQETTGRTSSQWEPLFSFSIIYRNLHYLKFSMTPWNRWYFSAWYVLKNLYFA